METRRRLRGNWWWLGALVALAVAAGVGLTVGYFVAVGLDRWWVALQPQCDGEPDCLPGLWAFGTSILAGALASALTIVFLAVRLRLGIVVPASLVTALLLLLAGGVWELGPDHGHLLLRLAGIELLASTVLARFLPTPWGAEEGRDVA